MRIDDRQDKSSTTSSPQASPGSAVGAKSNGHRIWSIAGDMEVRQDNAIPSSRNWSPHQEDKDDKSRSLDLTGQTILPEDSHLHSKGLSDPPLWLFSLESLLCAARDLAVEADARSLDERSDAASSGNETSVDVEVEVI